MWPLPACILNVLRPLLICGGSCYVESHELVKNMPVWAFHGEKDTVVLAERSEEIVEALKVNRGNVQFSFYPEAGHDFLDKNLRQSRAIRMVLKTYTLRLTN